MWCFRSEVFFCEVLKGLEVELTVHNGIDVGVSGLYFSAICTVCVCAQGKGRKYR